MALIEKEWLEGLLLAHEQNARSFEASGRKISFTYADGIRTAYADVGLCPSVDAVVVVRCKDCAIRYDSCPMVVRIGNNVEFFTEDDDFCSRGKGKGKEE